MKNSKACTLYGGESNENLKYFCTRVSQMKGLSILYDGEPNETIKYFYTWVSQMKTLNIFVPG